MAFLSDAIQEYRMGVGMIQTTMRETIIQASQLVCILGIITVVIVGIYSIWYLFSGRDGPVCKHIVNSPPSSYSIINTSRGRCRGHPSEPLDIASLKTGDLIAVSYGDTRLIFAHVATGSIWTHQGLVWIDPATQEPYIYEAAGYKPPYNHMIIRIPLLVWARINRHAHCIAHIPLNKPVDADALQRVFSEYDKLDIGLEGFRLDWFRFLTPKTPYTVKSTSLFAHPSRKEDPIVKEYTSLNPFGDYVRDSKWLPKWVQDVLGGSMERAKYPMTCTEIVINALQKVGVVDPRITPCSFIPARVANRDLPMINGYEYLEPIQVDVRPLNEIGMSTY